MPRIVVLALTAALMLGLIGSAAADPVLVKGLTINYVQQGTPSGLWNTQPSGFYLFESTFPWPNWNPTGESIRLPTPDQDARGIFGSAAMAEYGVMTYRCKKPQQGGAPNGCGATELLGIDHDIHRFVWLGACPGQAAFCMVNGAQLAGGIVTIRHTIVGGKYRLRIGVHGGPGGPGPGITDAILRTSEHAYTGFPLGFVPCHAEPYPDFNPGVCGPTFPGAREPLFGEGFTQTFHVADTRPSPNPVCAGLSQVQCMLSGIVGSFSAVYLPHIELDPCFIERGFPDLPGITACTGAGKLPITP